MKDLKYALSSLTEREAVFSKNDLYHALHKVSHGCLGVGDLDKMIKKAVKTGKLCAFSCGESYTTPQAIRMEKELLALLKESKNNVSSLEKPSFIEEKLHDKTPDRRPKKSYKPCPVYKRQGGWYSRGRRDRENHSTQRIKNSFEGQRYASYGCSTVKGSVSCLKR